MKEMQEHLQNLARDDVKGKSASEIKDFIKDWEIRFIQCEVIKDDLDHQLKEKFLSYWRENFKSDENVIRTLYGLTAKYHTSEH